MNKVKNFNNEHVIFNQQNLKLKFYLSFWKCNQSLLNISIEVKLFIIIAFNFHPVAYIKTQYHTWGVLYLDLPLYKL